MRSAFKNNSKEEGTLIYAWVYAILMEDDLDYTMANTKVDWPLMKRGLRILTDRDTSNLALLTALAKSACQMRDRAEA